MRKQIGVILTLLFLTYPAVAEESCEVAATRTVLKEIGRTNGTARYGRVLLARQTAGEVRPPLVDYALHVNAPLIAEEIVADFKAKNDEPRKLVKAPFDIIELADYQQDGAIDWARIDVDFGHADTVVELSRPGCDSTGSFGITRVQYHFRTPRNVPDAWLMQAIRDGAAEWRIGLMRSSSQELWQKSSCGHYTLPKIPEYPELCAKFAK